MRKFLVTAATAIAMTAAPTIASAQAAAPASAPTEVQPASEEVDGSALRNRGFILPVLVVIGAVLALYLLIDEDEVTLPVSP